MVYDNGDGASTVEAMNPEAALGIIGDNSAVADVARVRSLVWCGFSRSLDERPAGAVAPAPAD